MQTVVVLDRYEKVVQGLMTPKIVEQKEEMWHPMRAFPRKLTAIVIVVETKTECMQIIRRNTIFKPSTILLLSKNENRDELAFNNRQNFHLVDDSLSQNNISTTKKQTKIDKSAHKLHSLHPFI